MNQPGINTHLAHGLALLLKRGDPFLRTTPFMCAVARAFAGLALEAGPTPTGAERRLWGAEYARVIAGQQAPTLTTLPGLRSRFRREHARQSEVYQALCRSAGDITAADRQLLVDESVLRRGGFRTPDAVAAFDMMLVIVGLSLAREAGRIDLEDFVRVRSPYLGPVFESEAHFDDVAEAARVLGARAEEAAELLSAAISSEPEVVAAGLVQGGPGGGTQATLLF